MTDRIEDGGPAYPSTEEHPNYDIPMHHFGMSLRDYFAAQVVGATVASFDKNLPSHASVENFAKHAYRIADAMLEARARQMGVQTGRAA